MQLIILYNDNLDTRRIYNALKHYNLFLCIVGSRFFDKTARHIYGRRAGICTFKIFVKKADTCFY